MFYTYMWLREDGTPYYVGKGSGWRAYNKHDIGSAPPLGRIVFYIAKDEVDALDTEALLIWYYGRKDLGTGCLRNFTDGRENPPSWKGRKQSKEHVSKRIAARIAKGNYSVSPEDRLKISESTKLAMARPEVKEKLGNHCKGKPWSEARREVFIHAAPVIPWNKGTGRTAEERRLHHNLRTRLYKAQKRAKKKAQERLNEQPINS